MNTRLDNLPFQVYFDFGGNKKLINFYSNLEDAKNEINLNIEEYAQFKICFSSNEVDIDNTSRLFISQLEIIRFQKSNNHIKIDEDGNYYVSVNSDPIEIVFCDDSLQLNPGLCDIKVTYKGKNYFSSFSISYKNMTMENAKNMIAELNSIVKGIMFEVAYKSAIGDTSIIQEFDSNSLKKYFVIKENFSKLLICLDKITRKPSQNIEKVYRVMEYHNIKNIDSKSSRWLQSYNGQQKANYLGGKTFTKLLSPIKQINYDLDENRFVKYIINAFIKILQSIKSECEICIKEKQEVYESTRKHKEDSFQIHIIDKIVNIHLNIVSMIVKLININETPFWSNITPLYSPKNSYAIAMAKDGKYKIIYDIYKKLNTDTNINLDNRYGFIFKRTSLLYEYWCFFCIFQFLSNNMNFQASDDWSPNIISKNKLIPFIKEGGHIKLKKVFTNSGEPSDITIYLWFNKSIIKKIDKARSLHENIYILSRYNKDNKTHNKPDIRMDIFTNNLYMDSIIFDAKYRPLKNMSYEDVSEQLEDYGHRVYKTKGKGTEKIDVTVALYSNSEGDSNKISKGEDSHIYCFNLVPGGNNNEDFFDFLRNRIHRIIYN